MDTFVQMFPPFDETVSADGYRWWYLDAISDDGNQALTVILFVGSVFSPYYAHARRGGPANADNFCALNVALYGRPARWCMTERTALSTTRSPTGFAIGCSGVYHRDGQLTVDVDEWAVPAPRRVRGRITVDLPESTQAPITLEPHGNHEWQMLAPRAPVSVSFSKPGLSWHGTAYVDSNRGSVPLERSFREWHWSRAHLSDDSTVIQYDLTDRNGRQHEHTYRVDQHANLSPQAAVDQRLRLPAARYWRMPRQSRCDPGASIDMLRTLEDAPFYSRSQFETRIAGLHASCIHESLDLERFNRAWVQCLLPFRMPRNTRKVGPHNTQES